MCAEENRDGIVNEPCHADQIITLRKKLATLEFRDLMMLHLDKYTRLTQDEYTSSICQIDEYLDVKMCSCDSTESR